MSIFEKMIEHGHEQIIFNYDKKTGLKSIIAIHNTEAGPALGGTRVKEYASEEALIDALRLSEGMTYKNAASNIFYGGGKAVMWVDNQKNPKTLDKLRMHAQFVNTLNGRFITSKDVGINNSDLLIMNQVSPYSLGTKFPPSAYTANGVFYGMKACAKWVWKSEDLSGKTIAIQGIGGVGYSLAKKCYEAGAKIIVSDVNAEILAKAQKEFGAQIVEPDKFFEVECDIIAPCAFGACLNENTVPQIKAKIICGSANNQLKDDKTILEIEKRGILYAPDYIVNCGGVIAVASENENDSHEIIVQKVKHVYERLLIIFDIAKQKKVPITEVALEFAQDFMNISHHIRKIVI